MVNSSGKTRLRDQPILPLLAAIFFVMTFALKAFTDGPYVRGEISAAVAYLKYAAAALSCFTALAYFAKEDKRVFGYEFRRLVFIVFLFALTSIAMQLYTGIFSTAVYVELIKLAMPVFLAYCILNTLGEKMLHVCMLWVLAFSLMGYLVDLYSQGASVLSIFSADFEDFNSETEGSGFAEIALMLVFYFAFVGRSKCTLAISVLFTLLTFKRLGMLVAIVALIVGVFFPKLVQSKVSKSVIVACKLLTIFFAALWIWLLLPEQAQFFEQIFGKTQFSFTMGRSNSLQYLWLNNFQSYGFGSANEVIKNLYGVPFEMDLAKIAFELTPLVAIVFVWLFWDLSGSRLWGLLIVGYFMLNMITSDSLTSNFSFTLAYIVMGLVNLKSPEGEIDGDGTERAVSSSAERGVRSYA